MIRCYKCFCFTFADINFSVVDLVQLSSWMILTTPNFLAARMWFGTAIEQNKLYPSGGSKKKDAGNASLPSGFFSLDFVNLSICRCLEK